MVPFVRLDRDSAQCDTGTWRKTAGRYEFLCADEPLRERRMWDLKTIHLAPDPTALPRVGRDSIPTRHAGAHDMLQTEHRREALDQPPDDAGAQRSRNEAPWKLRVRRMPAAERPYAVFHRETARFQHPAQRGQCEPSKMGGIHEPRRLVIETPA